MSNLMLLMDFENFCSESATIWKLVGWVFMVFKIVIPLLLIDENDVKASHALTIGQPDADQLYYLQSRGLSTKQAVGLLSVGYFLPVIDLVEDEELKDSLRQEMESKVGLYGHQ